MGVGAGSDTYSSVNAGSDISGSFVDEFLLGRSGLDVTGPDASLAGR